MLLRSSGSRETPAIGVLHQSRWLVAQSCVECWRLVRLLCFPCCPPANAERQVPSQFAKPNRMCTKVFPETIEVSFFPLRLSYRHRGWPINEGWDPREREV